MGTIKDLLLQCRQVKRTRRTLSRQLEKGQRTSMHGPTHLAVLGHRLQRREGVLQVPFPVLAVGFLEREVFVQTILAECSQRIPKLVELQQEDHFAAAHVFIAGFHSEDCRIRGGVLGLCACSSAGLCAVACTGTQAPFAAAISLPSSAVFNAFLCLPFFR